MRLILLPVLGMAALLSISVPRETAAAPVITAAPLMTPGMDRSSIDEIYYYRGRYYPYRYGGRYYPYRYNGMYYNHRYYRYGRWHYY